METLTVLAIIGVVAAWGLLLVFIFRWGPRRVRRRVVCPEKQLEGEVVVELREGSFGSLRADDVTACSLEPQRELPCGKECLSQVRL